jgi:hypothetical protein
MVCSVSVFRAGEAREKPGAMQAAPPMCCALPGTKLRVLASDYFAQWPYTPFANMSSKRAEAM